VCGGGGGGGSRSCVGRDEEGRASSRVAMRMDRAGLDIVAEMRTSCMDVRLGFEPVQLRNCAIALHWACLGHCFGALAVPPSSCGMRRPLGLSCRCRAGSPRSSVSALHEEICGWRGPQLASVWIHVVLEFGAQLFSQPKKVLCDAVGKCVVEGDPEP
jgi:hypothetical protein